FILDRKREVRFHSGQDGVKIVGVNLRELAFPQLREGLRGLSRVITQDSHYEGEFFHLDGIPDLDVVGDVNSRGPYTIQLMLCTRSRHNCCLTLCTVPKHC